MSDIKAFFDANDCIAQYQLLDINSTKNNSSYFKDLFPFIVPIKKKKGLHYIVVNGIKKGKLKVYDSKKAKTYYLSIQELRKVAHYSDNYLDEVEMQKRLDVMINMVLKVKT